MLSRRGLLRAGGALAAASAAGLIMPPALVRAASDPPGFDSSKGSPKGSAKGSPKRISLFNLHTGEKSELEFYRDGDYVAEALARVQVLLRDFRNGAQHVIDPKLLDYLYDVARKAGAEPVFAVISGYRSPQTNEHLRELSDGVARHSLHLEGRAIDVRLAGVDCAELATRALGLSRGGVGYYRKSDFVHLDTGAFRTWNG